ncbi:HepT-like ribonuclease domain-containing protein [Thermodesulfovibrio yellowstonii]|uniref:HepT-like ribonuclease domain-containing protein n=1 Tax=Thermodesulfovibrio yellowstonii TaxID=28262 RepID=UPI0024B36E7D|nr:HepT-like ribonuclease domain-containing protein [Thermodesulfovibrio yellowstonii]MDI6864584.1 DUF86 domain-containing protein [Thermodesulfovibrio yellowstonii]
MKQKANKLLSFLNETIDYFLKKYKSIDKNRYFADRDARAILDKTINDIILCIVDICEEILKKNNRTIPDTYKDTVLACYEFIGDLALKLAPLTKHRNETIHQYLKMNWYNIQIVKSKLSEIQEFLKKTQNIFNS